MSLAGEVFRLFGTVAINGKPAEDALDKTTEHAKKSESVISQAFKKIGSAVATYVSAKALVDFGKASIAAASDVQEMQNKFDVVFQGMTAEVEEWADTYANSIGRNRNVIKGYLADNQNMFVGMGMTREVAAGLSEDMVTLALDLASFNNLNETDAVNAMSKALMGQSESAKSLGAVLNDNTLKMAMETMGIKKKFDALTEAEKMEVRYQAILMQSADAVGDCERSLESYKGQQIQLTSTIDHLKEKIGGYLLPVMTDLTGVANNIANSVLTNLDSAISNTKQWFENVGSYLSETFKPILDDLSDLFNRVKEYIQPLIDQLTDYVTSGEAAKDATELLKTACEGLVAGYEYLKDVIIPGLIEEFNDLVQWFKDAKTWCEENATALELVAVAFGTLTTAIVVYNVARAIKNAGGIVELVQLGMLAVGLAGLTVAETAHTVATTIATAATSAFAAVMAFLTSPITLVIAAIGLLVAAIIVCVKHWDEISAFAIKCWESIKSAWNSAAQWFDTTVVQPIHNLFTGIWETISGILDSIYGYFEEKFNAVLDFLSPVIDTVKGIFNFEWKLPHIALPHFAVSPSGWQIGDLLKGSIPKLGIDWYAEGGVMEQPTVFGINGNKAMVGGEAGSEAIAPIDVLQGYVSAAVASQNAVLVDILERILDAITIADEGIGEKIRNAVDGSSLNVNKREFARLVKAVD